MVLRSFRVANHRSIRDEQELLLIPVYDKDRLALPVTAIYGANASGKSNLLDALQFVQRAVRDSYQRWSPGGGIPRDPFRLSARHRNTTSWYVLEVLVDNVRWTYGFEVDDQRVHEEWLYTYPQQRRRVVFERDGDGIRFGSTISTSRERARLLTELTRDNALFLSLGAQTGLSDVLPVYNWLDQLLRIPEQASRRDGLELADYLRAHPDRRAEIRDMIRIADFGISDYDLNIGDDDAVKVARDRLTLAEVALARSRAEHDRGGSETTAAEVRRAQSELEAARVQWSTTQLRFVHGDSNELFEPADESAGTRSWLSLLPTVLTALDVGQTLVIDELDTSLHPRLLARVLELFRDPATNPSGGQLLFTTHDATLLGTSFGIPVLERDEVWFIDKDRDTGATVLFALSDFHPRKGENAERRYLGGSYGAVPAVYSDSFVRQLVRSRQDMSDAAS